LQQTFKVLINSFYGYLGTEHHHFSDPEIAAQVTRHGREIIHQMLHWLGDKGAKPVEIDTDGIYFVPPPEVETEDQARVLVEDLSRTLPFGIDVSMDGRFPAMFSYKMKNYALLDGAGNMVVKGSALRSRGMEKYLREFLTEMLRLLLEGEGEGLHGLFEAYLDKIERHQLGISWLAKTETLRESLDSYQQKVRAKKRNPAALYELAMASGRDYKAGDQISHYVTGNKKKVRVYENCKLASDYDPSVPDENVAYYQEKLLNLYEKFKEFIPSSRAQESRAG
jgi:DNA polymerase elongation subunit (family B)